MIFEFKRHCGTPYWAVREDDLCSRVEVYCRNSTHRMEFAEVELDTALTICETRNMETYTPEPLPPNQLVLTNYRRVNGTAFRETKTGHEINTENRVSYGHRKFPAKTIAEFYKCSQEVLLINEHPGNTKVNACLCAEKDSHIALILYSTLAVLGWLFFGLLAFILLKK